VRDRDGVGQHIDVSMLESAIALQAWETSSYLATGEVPGPLGSAHRFNAPYQAFRTADGHITIGATTPANWQAFCATLGLQQIEDDARFVKVSDRRRNYKELAGLIEAVTTAKPSDHWYRALERAGVPCGVLYRLDQVLDDEHVKARGVVREVAHTKLGTVRVTGSPVRFSRTPVRVERAGPLLGEHTRDILGELGRTDIAELEGAGVVGAARPLTEATSSAAPRAASRTPDRPRTSS